MNARNFHLCFCTLGLVVALTASPVQAQTRVGEAAVVKNEVVRVAGSATNQINVGDALLRDEVVRTGLDSATRLVMADSTNCGSARTPRSSSTAPFSTTSTTIATSRYG
jgi:hypothetical protein